MRVPDIPLAPVMTYATPAQPCALDGMELGWRWTRRISDCCQCISVSVTTRSFYADLTSCRLDCSVPGRASRGCLVVREWPLVHGASKRRRGGGRYLAQEVLRSRTRRGGRCGAGRFFEIGDCVDDTEDGSSQGASTRSSATIACVRLFLPLLQGYSSHPHSLRESSWAGGLCEFENCA